jgi:hypothetical protein
MPVGRCRLCHVDGELQQSHILPAFLFRWVRETSANGYLRFGATPNLRVQDGLKRHWLCAGCEGVFSRSETAFAEKLFYPYVNGNYTILYEEWLLRFCVSVSWRVLTFYKEETQFAKNHGPEALQRIAEAESTWRMFLLDKREHPGRFHQYILPFEAIGSISNPSMDLSSNLNRYLMRTIDTDLCRSQTSNFVYCKLPRFAILGVIHEERQNQWQGTKVRLKRGLIEPQRYTLPAVFFEYLNGKSRREVELLRSISPRQHERIEQSFRDNAERFVGTDAFLAMQYDIDMFGDDAFTWRDAGSDPVP